MTGKAKSRPKLKPVALSRPGPPYYDDPRLEYEQAREQRRPKLTDYQTKSVEEYIGDSGEEFEVKIYIFLIFLLVQSAAEKIVEGYMGEYMDEYMNEWYIQYCR